MAENCFNCTIYGWKQPKDNLKRCSRCKVATYCSEQCQKEHWQNTHKKHCKYMSGKKVLAAGKHDSNACFACKEEGQAGKEAVSDACSSALPCTMSQANMRQTNLFMFDNVHDSIPLAEMSGNFHSKLDNSLAIAMRILMKLKLANSIPWTVNQSRSEDLYKSLGQERFAANMTSMLEKPGTLKDQIDNEDMYEVHYFSKIYQAFQDIMCSISEEVYLRGLSEAWLWDTFRILIGLIGTTAYAKGRCIADKLGVPELPGDMQKARLSHSQLMKMWEDVLEILRDGLVPIESLHKAISKNLHVEHCYGCKVQVSEIKSVVFSLLSHFEVPTVPFLVLDSIGSVYFLCGELDCSAKLNQDSQRPDNIEMRITLLYIRLTTEYGGDLCDYCGLFNQEVRGHRCAGCRTKVYCGMECYRMDTVHHTLCVEGDMRRRKRGKDIRREKGRNEYVQITSVAGIPAP